MSKSSNQFLLFILVYILTGLISFAISNHNDTNDLYIIIPSLISGLLFTCTTATLGYFTKKDIPFNNIRRFIFTCFSSYIAIFVVTYSVGFLGLFLGFFTSGIGSIVVFLFFDDYIFHIDFKKRYVFFIGAFCWVFPFLILEPISKYYNFVVDGHDTIGISCFYLLWQSLNGIFLSKKMIKFNRNI